MSRDAVIAAQLTAIQQGETQVIQSALGSAYDGGAQDQQAIDGSQTSPADAATIAQLQQQLAAAQAQDQADVAAGQQALATANQQIQTLNQQITTLQSAKSADDAVIQGFQSAVSTLQSSLAALEAIINPPAPASTDKKS